MARNEENQALTNAKTGQSLENSEEGQANSELGSLLPAFQSEAANPQGFGPVAKAQMNTAAQQSAGGSVAGAVGQGNLEAARTRNAGGFAPALDAAAEGAGRTLSNDALGVDKSDAMLKNNQQQAGLNGMLGLYDTSTQAGLNALGASTSAVNSATGADNSTQQQWLGPLNTVLGNASYGKGGASYGG